MAKKGGFLLGAVVGGTAAAIAALLLAPKSGLNEIGRASCRERV